LEHVLEVNHFVGRFVSETEDEAVK